MCYPSNKTCDDSNYIPGSVSNSHLVNVTAPFYDRLEVQLKTFMSGNYMNGLFDSEHIVALNGILNKSYESWCQPDHYIKSFTIGRFA